MSQLLQLKIIENLKNLIHSSRTQVVQSVNTIMVQTYWHIGKMIVEDEQNGEVRAEYGKKQLEHIAKELTQEFGKGFDVSNLRNMRRFYLTFPIQETVSLKLSWSHYCKLVKIENHNAREWYIQETIANNWSVRALERQISVLYYKRLLSSKEKVPVEIEAERKTKGLSVDIKDFIRDPYILDFLNLPSTALESSIEQALIDNLQHFLLELGRGFAFVSRQQRLSVEEQDFYIDLVFYNFKLKCFLLIDLKLGRLTHQDVGQMDTYVRVYDQHHKSEDDNPTIGLILCSEHSQAVAKYSVLSDSKQLFASKYLPFLPSVEELQQELLRERNLLAGGMKDE